MIIDFEQKTIYPLTPSNDDFSCRSYFTFVNLDHGCSLFLSKDVRKKIEEEYGIWDSIFSDYLCGLPLKILPMMFQTAQKEIKKVTTNKQLFVISYTSICKVQNTRPTSVVVIHENSSPSQILINCLIWKVVIVHCVLCINRTHLLWCVLCTLLHA